MGRPPNPITVSGTVYVWAQGLDGLKIASLHKLPQAVARALANGHTGFTYAGVCLNLLGVLLGSATEEEIIPRRLEVSPYGNPVVGMYGLAVEGRIPGIPCTLNLFSETARNRQWMASFGHEPPDFWERSLGVPTALSSSPGAFCVTTRADRNKLRAKFWAARKVADLRWRS